MMPEGNDTFSLDTVEMYMARERTVLWLTVREGRKLILKGLPEQLRNHPEEVSKLRKEYSIGMRLDHPGLVRVYGFENRTEIGSVIVMEYLEGVTLAEFLSRGGKLAPDRKTRIRIARQLAAALRHIHESGVAHRDLKPDNIIITRHGNNVKVIDFGHADTPDSVVFKNVIGTEEYGTPEQQVPSPAGEKADVFAYGKMLEELLPYRRFGRLRRECLANDPAKRPDMVRIERRLERSRLNKPVIATIIVIAAAITCLLLFWLLATNKEDSLPKESATVNETIQTGVPTDSSSSAELPSIPNDNRNVSLPIPIQHTPSDSSITAERKHTPSDTQGYENEVTQLLDFYINKAAKNIEMHSPKENQDMNNQAYRDIMEKRNNGNWELAQSLEKELKDKGLSNVEITRNMESFWFYVVSKINSHSISGPESDSTRSAFQE